jgi:hypothetical protein
MVGAGVLVSLATLVAYIALDRTIGSDWNSRLALIGVMAVASTVGLLAYLLLARLLRIQEVAGAVGLVRRRLGR